jgi:hypothetical protein
VKFNYAVNLRYRLLTGHYIFVEVILIVLEMKSCGRKVSTSPLYLNLTHILLIKIVIILRFKYVCIGNSKFSFHNRTFVLCILSTSEVTFTNDDLGGI